MGINMDFCTRSGGETRPLGPALLCYALVCSGLLCSALLGPWHLALSPWPLAIGPWPLAIGPARSGSPNCHVHFGALWASPPGWVQKCMLIPMRFSLDSCWTCSRFGNDRKC